MRPRLFEFLERRSVPTHCDIYAISLPSAHESVLQSFLLMTSAASDARLPESRAEYTSKTADLPTSFAIYIGGYIYINACRCAEDTGSLNFLQNNQQSWTKSPVLTIIEVSSRLYLRQRLYSKKIGSWQNQDRIYTDRIAANNTIHLQIISFITHVSHSK